MGVDVGGEAIGWVPFETTETFPADGSARVGGGSTAILSPDTEGSSFAMLTFVSCNDDAPVFLFFLEHMFNKQQENNNNKLTIVNCKDLSAQF